MQACCEKGPARMAEIGHSQLERIIAGLANITPDFADMSWSRLRGYLCPVRIEIAPDLHVAALTALGALPQPKTHI